MKDISQLIYDDTFKLCLRFTNKVYTKLPGDVGYPFIYIGEQFDQSGLTKDKLSSVGTLQQTIHIYGLADDRKGTTDLLRNIRLAARFMKDSQYSANQVNTDMIEEKPNQTETLIHGILTMEFSYYQDERGN
ncbi:hypothetical protein [Lapidilactobacillus bayanensis]|uniref:hypothetical protein n=1 Tax=Lapidilactobacillus bayanensis TaxID=2485998 RepID=UPI000F79253C|nr:hypothetical protein [Lapidilactobacillus bayanensis]